MVTKFQITFEKTDRDEFLALVEKLIEGGFLDGDVSVNGNGASVLLPRAPKPRAKPFEATRRLFKAAGDALPRRSWAESMRPLVETLASQGKTGTGQLVREFERRRVPMERGGLKWSRGSVRHLLIKLGHHGQLAPRKRRAAL